MTWWWIFWKSSECTPKPGAFGVRVGGWRFVFLHQLCHPPTSLSLFPSFLWVWEQARANWVHFSPVGGYTWSTWLRRRFPPKCYSLYSSSHHLPWCSDKPLRFTLSDNLFILLCRAEGLLDRVLSESQGYAICWIRLLHLWETNEKNTDLKTMG